MILTRRDFVAALTAGGACCIGTQTQSVALAADVRAGFTRIAGSFDGNWHDKDDWVSVYVALGLLGKVGLGGRLVHLHINCHEPESNRDYEQQMIVSANRGLLNYGPSIGYFDAQHSDTSVDLSAHINLSSLNNKLAILAAGPMHYIYHALAASNRAAHPFIGILSHTAGKYNDVDGTYNLKRIQRDFPAVSIYHIPNQNTRLNTGTNFRPWYPLRDSPDHRAQYAYKRMRDIGKGDCSDAGMYWFAITGNPNPTPADICRVLA